MSSLTRLEELSFNILLYQANKGFTNLSSVELANLHPDLNPGSLQYILKNLRKKKYITWVTNKAKGRTFCCLVTQYSREHPNTIPPFSCFTKVKQESEDSLKAARAPLSLSPSLKEQTVLKNTLSMAENGEKIHLIEEIQDKWKDTHLDLLTLDELAFLNDVLSSITTSPEDLLKKKLLSLEVSQLDTSKINQLLAVLD